MLDKAEFTGTTISFALAENRGVYLVEMRGEASGTAEGGCQINGIVESSLVKRLAFSVQSSGFRVKRLAFRV